MDLLSEAVEALRLRRIHYRRDDLKPLAAPSEDNGCGLHIVLRGRASLVLQSTEITLGVGDMVLLPRPLRRALGAAAQVEARLLSAQFEFDSPGHPLLSALPGAIHVSGEQLEGNRHWRAQLDCLLAELDQPREGSRVLVARSTEALFIHAMRAAPPPARAECPNGGGLRGLYDPALQPVLSAMHGAPGHGWTLARLARIAGQSRSAFAAHFADAMGEPPMSYLARWRMFRARSLLRESELTLATIAEQVGYGSATAFSLAFSREHGISPGAFRAQARQALTSAAVAYRSARA